MGWLRNKISMWLVNLAYKIYSPNPKVMEFYMKVMKDQLITGSAIIRIDPSNYLKEE